jgi:uncharacterized protein
MIFILILTLLFGAVALFVANLIEFGHPVTVALGIAWGAVVLFSFVFMMRFFRRRTDNYRAGFSIIGLLIAATVPTLFYLPFGLVHLGFHRDIMLFTGWTVALLTLAAIMVGIVFGRWNWQVRSLELVFGNLPQELDGLKIVQISDVHVGSFFRKYHKVEKAIAMINSLKADYVLFTGDLVNNAASEMEGWESVFSRIEAKKGKYSILGNHDYGDYMKWDSGAAKTANLNKLIEVHKAIGFTPLLNDSVKISENDNGAYIVGVENWGTGGFRQSGDLAHALENVPPGAFRVLMSHDPSHFDAQVAGTGIDLTLSGHTHGMQFGIERFGIRFSPVQWRYPRWAGLYKVGQQFLYVNRGFGYLGFPGRVGIYPEITEIILRKEQSLQPEQPIQ